MAYSGGKDSLAVLDLAVTSGRRCEAFFMHFLPGLDYSAYWCELARKRWGVTVREYLHWNTVALLRAGLFRAEPLSLKKISIRDIERQARAASGIEWIAYGYKLTDSLHRRGMINAWPDGIAPAAGVRGRICAPLKHWCDREVHAYLARRRLPIPSTGGTARNSGVTLSPFSLEWIRAEWPADYKRILKVFPYAAAHADRAPQLRKQLARQKEERRQTRKRERSTGTAAG